MLSIFLIVICILNIYNNLSDKLKEIVNYIIVGGCTTLVNIVSFFFLRLANISTYVSNGIAWVLAVLFAFITNSEFSLIGSGCDPYILARILLL